MAPPLPLIASGRLLTVDLLAQALYAEWRARQDVSRRAFITDRWREAQARGLDRPWLTKAAHVLAWLPVLATPAEEETP